MIRILLSVAVLSSACSVSGLELAQGQKGEKFGSDVASALARLEAQCAHRRRTMPPDERDDCIGKLNKLRSDAQLASGQGAVEAGGEGGQGIGPGNSGQGNGLGNAGGPGNAGPGNGAGQGNGVALGNGGGNGNQGRGGGGGGGRR